MLGSKPLFVEVCWWREGKKGKKKVGSLRGEVFSSWVRLQHVFQQDREATVGETRPRQRQRAWARASNHIVEEGLRQRLRGHQSFQEASLLCKLAATQRTHVQRLSTENKGGFSYIPFRAGYRNGGGVQFVPYIITCYFIGCFNLWGEVTLLWSPGNIPQLQFSFVLL
jgi:hypothetical protein